MIRLAFRIKMILLLSFLAIAIIIGLSSGSVNIPFSELFRLENITIAKIRLMRVLLALIAGCGLSVSGIALQAVLRNPLAEPYLLGTSSGAGLGAVVAVVFGCNQSYLPAAAFAGAISSVSLVYAIARQARRIPVQALVLSGVIVSVAISGIMVFIVSSSPNEALHGLTWWLWGSLEVYNISLLITVSIVTIAGVAVVYIFSQDLNAISIGEEEAIHLGIDAEAVKKVLLLTTSLITASLVCVSGIIGFVGLVIPHIMRLAVGPNHKTLIPASCIGGAIFMILCDAIGRTCFAPSEIPIGVITAIVGAPVFIMLLKINQKVR